MKSMVRHMALGFALVALVGCASSRTKSTQVVQHDSQFVSEEQKLLACLDLRDHIVDLYADQYVAREGLAMTAPERSAFRAGWAEELAKRGTFERFEQSCFSGVTPRKYRCAMESPTPDSLIVCMKLSEG